MDIKYTLTFYSEWHCGSGLAAGADLDALVVKDRNGLPFVPGKTIKGLVREAVEDMLYFTGKTDKYRNSFVETFGNSEDLDWDMLVTDCESKMRKGNAFFTNAELDDTLRNRIVAESLQSFMYRGISSTSIGDDGLTIDNSLRRTEVVVPCVLKGCILDIPEDMTEMIENSLQLIKRLGQKRNRGLGRCEFKVIGGITNG